MTFSNQEIKYITRTIGIYPLAASPDGKRLYFTYQPKIYSIEPPVSSESPTPTPGQPTPTPTPIKAWFVLDGFGGIHSSNPAVKPPILPYFAPFNIVRDIEPDPQGRGWYMLDGFGGIHTDSPDLPKPTELPYFGFDIARKLKVRQTDQGYKFYLMDGFGAIHTDDKTFSYGFLPWFGDDVMRDLKADSTGIGWLMMDSNGIIYLSNKPVVDVPLYITRMRSFVRFPDETTVLMDAWGGRHTNPYYPARDVVNGLPLDFYFPGWDII